MPSLIEHRGPGCVSNCLPNAAKRAAILRFKIEVERFLDSGIGGPRGARVNLSGTPFQQVLVLVLVLVLVCYPPPERQCDRGNRKEPMVMLLNRLLLLTLMFGLPAAAAAQTIDSTSRQPPESQAILQERSSGRFYDSRGSFAGRSQANGNTTRLYDSRGSFAGRVQANGDRQSRLFDSRGSYTGRADSSGNDTRFYDSKGSLSGRSTTSGNITRFYDSRGAYAGKAETSGNTIRYYDKSGRYLGSKRK